MGRVGSVEGRQRSRSMGPSWTRRQILARAGGAAAALAVRPGLAGASESVATAPRPEPVVVNGRMYDAYMATALKPAQYFYYTCEFDSAWVIMKTFGVEVSFEEQLAIVGYNRDPEPFWTDTPDGIVITGGDIGVTFCGDYTSNLVAKIRGSAMKPIFDAYDFPSTPIKTRADVENCLLAGGLVFVKCTVDFLPHTPAVWVATNGNRYPVPFANDHAAVVMGFNGDGVVVRDVLGPTNTKWDRQYEYEVPWAAFIASMEAHEWDGLSVYPQGATTPAVSPAREIVPLAPVRTPPAPKTDGTGGENPRA